MYFDTVLDKERIEILPLFTFLPDEFYLSGGTALALQLNHRISVDFDFFSPQSFDTQKLFEKLTYDIFADQQLTIIQEAANTLDILLQNQIKISFFRYRYPLVYPLVPSPYFNIASVQDIAASKLIAITQRAAQKDYFDIYYVLQRFSLESLFDTASKKYPSFNPMLYLKALTYYDDCDPTSPRLISSDTDFDRVKTKLTTEANSLFEKLNQTHNSL